MQSVVIEGVYCPDLACATASPERTDVDPGGKFVWATCRRCSLTWKVSG